MSQDQNQPQVSDLDRQVEFAKDKADKGYKIIATALSWAATKLLEDALRSKGVEVEGIALDPLSKQKGVFDHDAVVVWGDSSPRVLEHAQPLMDLVEEKARSGSPGVCVYLVIGPQFKLLPGPDVDIPSRQAKPSM